MAVIMDRSLGLGGRGRGKADEKEKAMHVFFYPSYTPVISKLTVDGRNPVTVHMDSYGKYSVIYTVSYISGGAEVQPSKVAMENRPFEDAFPY